MSCPKGSDTPSITSAAWPATALVWINAAISQGANLHSQMNGEAINGISVAWPKVPFQLGAWGTSNPATLLTADDNIHYAGEHLSVLQGWQEGAILSAYHAIDQIVAKDSV